MKRFLSLLFAATAIAALPAIAQQNVPTLQIDATNALTMPDDLSIYLGEVDGVATDSKGNIYVYNRTGHPFVTLGGARAFAHGGATLYQFDKDGKFVREIGHNAYGFMFGNGVRVDPQDNIWVIDQMSNMIIKFNPQGEQVMLLGRKAEAIPIPARAGGGEGGGGNAGRGQPGAGAQNDVFNRPSDVTWDAAGNIYVADGQGNSRVAKFTKDGVFVKSWGFKGSGQGQFDNVRDIQIDAQGNVYVGDGGNHRIQVFDTDGNFKRQITGINNPQAMCLTKGADPILWVSNSNPPNNFDVAGEIYKMKTDGTILGKFGRAGKMLKEFGTVNAIDCRNENTLYIGEIANLRVQKVIVH